MSRSSCSFPSVMSVLVTWLCVSYLEFSVAHCRPIEGVEVQHSVAIPAQSDATATDPVAAAGVYGGSVHSSRGMSDVLVNRRLHMPLRPRSLVVPKYMADTRGRKMMFGARGCATEDLTLIQGPVSTTSGIPTFSVQIINLCGNCALGAIHVACGNWASATPVDPYIFTRLAYNDCLVNNGKPLMSQGSISFQYSNSAMYPMSIVSANNDCNSP
ncbi:unnamed protein product [Calypogeia fissa]